MRSWLVSLKEVVINMKKNKNETHNHEYSKTIVVLCIVSVWIYVITNIVASVMGAMISDSLTSCFFAFFGIEILALASIRKTKEKNAKFDGTSLQENIDRMNDQYEEDVDSLSKEIEEAIKMEREEE